ncbi:excinuclease ABC subunit UvrA [Candidatus Babeliales bacterium]|nr:excinuclease ABC subunit UvrA [Candidatus Babeliales bacterium]
MEHENKVRIKVIGAREHNLKNVTVEIPKDTLTVITGPSGSGKSSLALDILYTEGKRRYTESLSAYARQFLGIAKKPDVDSIEGLCPAIAIEQKTVGSNPRSTVGTITEIYDYLRVLFARIGNLYCPDCGTAVGAHSAESITYMVLANFKHVTILVAAPVARQEKGEFKNTLLKLFKQGYYRFKIDGKIYKISDEEELKALKIAKTYKHDIDILIDAITVDPEETSRLQESIEQAGQLAQGLVKIIVDEQEYLYSSHSVCLKCATSFPEMEPRYFSFNSPMGACKPCSGLGIINEWPWEKGDPDFWKAKYPDFFGKYAKKLTCTDCMGKRLNKMALSVLIQEKNIVDIADLSIEDALHFCKNLRVDETSQIVATPLLREITKRLQFLFDVGLPYVTLNRSAQTLSGGEGQRIRLATQIGSALSGVLYILDEPSIGLHQRDNDRLIETLKNLRDQGNTVIVVEHDIDTIRAADFVIDMGPAAGVHGGHVTATGTPEALSSNKNSLTGAYLSGRKEIVTPKKYRQPQEFLLLEHASKHNLKDLTVKFPLKVLCGISGVSGSGKSTLIMEELVPALERELTKKPSARKEHTDLAGAEILKAMVVIDQAPIGRSSRSNPATYLGIFDQIRKLFASLPVSNVRGYKIGRFSFNRPDGRCFECNGDGTITVSMHFLADVTMECKSCKGKRYNQETLQVTYRQKNIAQILDMTAFEACEFFKSHKLLHKRLELLCDVGLDYIKLGQGSPTLSGGEAQRIKLVNELAKRGQETLYILDEPTTGLHNSDIEKLLVVLNRLVDQGNSMIIIEHNLDVLKTVDYLIDLGPEGGANGGTIVAQGSPRTVAIHPQSYTGTYLKKIYAK